MSAAKPNNLPPWNYNLIPSFNYSIRWSVFYIKYFFHFLRMFSLTSYLFSISEPLPHFLSPLSPIAECNSPPADDSTVPNHPVFDFTQSALDLRESANTLMRNSKLRHSVMGLLYKIDEKWSRIEQDCSQGAITSTIYCNCNSLHTFITPNYQ